MKEIKNKSIKCWIGILSCVMLFVFIGGFAFIKMKFIFTGVKIEASIDQDDSSLVRIKGNAKNATHLLLNGREISINKEGFFEEPLILLSGVSVLTLNAQDKFGNFAEKKFEVVYKENNQVALVN
jgi:hypothetical protein